MINNKLELLNVSKIFKLFICADFNRFILV